jgi:hypothetical protein
MASIRALEWAASVFNGICQFCQERAGMPSWRNASARSPVVTCSPVETITSYSSSKPGPPVPGPFGVSPPASRASFTSLSVSPDMADTTTATPLPGLRSAATIRATRRMRSTSPTDVPPNFITTRVMGWS